MTDADRYHIPPTAVECCFCGPGFLGQCPHRPSTGVKTSSASVDVHELLGIRKVAASVDLAPFVAWFRDELSRERTAAADAKCEARGHRERVVELEARLKAAEAERDRAVHNMEHAQCDARDARQMLAEARGRGRPIIATGPVLTPGSTAAVIEAYRLLCGHEPTWDNRSLWTDIADCPDDLIDKALGRLISWLDVNAPGGKP
jgi:hypothetical protein